MRFFTALLSSMVLAMAATDSAKAADVYNAYAAPNTWGPAVALRAHLGPATYTVSYDALGKTSVIGEVTYYGPDGRWVTRQFFGSITFRTGNGVDAPTVRFKGTP